MDNCLFCKIVAGIIPSKRIYEDTEILAFHDIHPAAPVHLLVIPKRHIPTLDDLTTADQADMGRLLERVAHVARLAGVAESGYRTIINTRDDGGQEVFHLHVHILGGRRIGPMVATRVG